MSKRSVALVGVLILMVMIGSMVIGAYSAVAKALNDMESGNLFLPLIMNAINPQVEVPSGAVMFFNLSSCPSGWTEMTDARGRAIVGLPARGTLAGTAGSELSDLENREHTHDVAPLAFFTGPSGEHDHLVDPPSSEISESGEHRHYIDPPMMQTFPNTTAQLMLGTAGPTASISLTHTHNFDMDIFFSDLAGTHTHSVDIPEFTSASSGSHVHAVSIPNTTSTTASTSDVIPYIQLLVCEKD